MIWIERLIKESIIKAADSRPVVLLTGVRQSGKSSLLQRVYPQTDYISFDHFNQMVAATDSPDFFLGQFTGPVILDEIQYVPNLFRELKIHVDNDRENYGKWILTGSQRFHLMENVSESLAGRISIQHLETLSAAELRASKVDKFEDYIWKGGYPETWSHPGLSLNDFFESYIRTYIERDLKNIVEVRNLGNFQRFIRVLATRIGQLINYRDISSDIGVSDVTIKKWVNALETSGLIYILPPYFRNIGKRLIKSAKIYFADHGLACFLLGIEDQIDWNKSLYKGNLWENLVMMEILKTTQLRPGYDIFFYRDHNGVEIDFVIERKNTLYFIEAKSSQRIVDKKLNFNKVMPLFNKVNNVKAILMQNLPDRGVIKTKDLTCLNPVNTNISEALFNT